jgi:hypothetical protein
MCVNYFTMCVNYFTTIDKYCIIYQQITNKGQGI